MRSRFGSLTRLGTYYPGDIEEYWGEFPSFIGQNGFLDRIRYAVYSSTDMFYFGELP